MIYSPDRSEEGKESESRFSKADVGVVVGGGQEGLLAAELGLVGSHYPSGRPLAMGVQRGMGPC